MEQEMIGKFISACRKEKGLTQMQLAEKLNITNRAVSKWETGKSMPDVSLMLDLCSILGITVNVPFPKKQTQKKLRKPNEAKEINQPAQSGKQNDREPAIPKRSEAARGYKKPQCTQKCRPEPELGKQNAAGE